MLKGMEKEIAIFEEQIKRAEEYLEINFSNKELLRTALTHPSFALEAGSAEVYEKLEFLGDSVLSLTVTEFIFHRFPKFDEGDLAKLRANLVNIESLAEVASKLRLGECLFMGKGAERSGVREKTSALGDCLEAVIGAIFLDQGMEAVKEFILTSFKEVIFREASAKDFSDFKTSLQEYTMEKLKVLPEYKVVEEKGPVHQRVFMSEVRVKGRVFGQGQGHSKKKSEQAAAKVALSKLRQELD